MSRPVAVGVNRKINCVTRPEHTARYFYENLPDVFDTPFLAGFMERVSAELIHDYLEPGEQSVGISMDIRHLAATPLGMTIRVATEVTAVDGAKLTFRLQAWDETEKIGEAQHERFIIKTDTFNARVAGKLQVPA